jgi:hypothetical protein
MIGMNFTNLMEPWPKEGTHGRIWDIGVTWKDIHLAPNIYDWTRLDLVVEKMERMGMNITYVVGATPKWLAKYPNNPHYAPWLGEGSNSMPYDIEEFNRFIWNISVRYKGRIHNYEIWNEPQLADFLYPYVPAELNTLATMTKRAYNTIKRNDQTAKVLGASVLPRPSSGGMKKATKYLDAMKLKGYPVDVWTCHIYPEGNNSQAAVWIDNYNAVRNEIASRKTGTNRIWVTETGLGLLQDPIPSDKCFQYTKRIYEHMNSHVFWYAWNRPDLGGAYIGDNSPQWNAIKMYHLT